MFDPLRKERSRFSHNERLQYTVRVNGSNPGLANHMLEQFCGPLVELAAACRYFTQALGEDDPAQRHAVGHLDREAEPAGDHRYHRGHAQKGAKGRLAEGVEEEGEVYRTITGAGNDSHIAQVLYGGGHL